MLVNLPKSHSLKESELKFTSRSVLPKAHILATVSLKEEREGHAELRMQHILTGGEVISGGVDMSPKSSNWVTA